MKTKKNHKILVFNLKDAGIVILTIVVCSTFLLVPSYFTDAAGVGFPLISMDASRQPPAPPSRVETSEFRSPSLSKTLVMQTPAGEPGWSLAAFETICHLPEPELILPTVATFTKKKRSPSETQSAKRIPYHAIIQEVAVRYQVDPHLIRAIIFAESGYNPNAKSKKGARGLMQLMPATAESLGVRNIDDPEENIDGGVRYFRSLLDRFDGDVQLALAAYNAGSRHVRNYEGVPPFKATQRYIKKVLKFHQKFKAEMDTGARKLA